MINVYHNMLFLQMQFKQPDSIPRLFLEHVASVDEGKFIGLKKSTEKDLDKTFELTNHIEHDWTKNKEVTPTKLNPRSTSVGDVLEINNKYYMVCTAGFKEVTIIERNKLTEKYKADSSLEKHLRKLLKDDFDKYIEIK